MPPKEKTLTEPPETLGNQTEYENVMARLRSISNYLTQVLDAQAVQAKQLDHLDGMLHEVHQFIDEHKPALNKALSLLDPGSSVRKYLKARKGVEPDGG
jgi:ABC-type transporter Mla subunit MlaD